MYHIYLTQLNFFRGRFLVDHINPFVPILYPLRGRKRVHWEQIGWNYSHLIREDTSSGVTYFRSNLPEEFNKKLVLKNFEKLTGKHLCQSPFLIKLQASSTRTEYGLNNFANGNSLSASAQNISHLIAIVGFDSCVA